VNRAISEYQGRSQGQGRAKKRNFRIRASGSSLRQDALRACGETLVQLLLIGFLIFVFERVELLRIELLGWAPEVIWCSPEAGVAFAGLLIASLLITNLCFASIRGRWWVRGVLASGMFPGIYFLIETICKGLLQFQINEPLIYYLILFLPVCATNLVFNRAFPRNALESQTMLRRKLMKTILKNEPITPISDIKEYKM